MSETVTKTQARASIREARETLRILEAALKSDDWERAYVLSDDEPLASLSTALYDTRQALGGTP